MSAPERGPPEPAPLAPAPIEPGPLEPVSIRALRAFGRMLLRVPRSLGFVPPLLWAGLIFFGSSQPAPKVGVPGIAGGVIENLAHAVEYGILAALLALCVRRERGWVVLGRASVAAILVICAVYAASDEWHQSFVPNRDATIYDVITDVCGAASTLACIDAIGRASSAGRTLAVRFATGLLVCLAAATLATFEPW